MTVVDIMLLDVTEKGEICSEEWLQAPPVGDFC
jgi:hypothetical protein